MSDLTVFAEALIATVARAFYDDEVVVLIDVLIRDKFLRDDDMAPRLSLPAKKLRATLQFLQEEHLVNSETVDDLAQGGSQATKFYYLDYNRAVHSIRLRLHLLRKQLEQAELRARSSSFYLCPGYKEKRCNGRYTEEEAQQVLDRPSGLFLCRECAVAYQNDPNRPPMETYTLQLVDNTRDLKQAMDNLRRVNVQLSAKYIGNDQLRAGIYDLLQKVRAKGKIITSNLPSENFALGIGSKRLAGTGRTAGIKAKKLAEQGVAHAAALARNHLVVGGRPDGNGGLGNAVEMDWMFLKNAVGNEIHFTVERGGGARAQLLASRRRRKRKLIEAAASRVGASLPLLEWQLQDEERKRNQARQEEEDARRNNTKVKRKGKAMTLEFLQDNIGRSSEKLDLDHQANENYNSNGVNQNNSAEMFLDDYAETDMVVILSDEEVEALKKLPEESRRAAFQAQYKTEIERQLQLFGLALSESPRRAISGSHFHSGGLERVVSIADTDDEKSLLWEDGEL